MAGARAGGGGGAGAADILETLDFAESRHYFGRTESSMLRDTGSKTGGAGVAGIAGGAGGEGGAVTGAQGAGDALEKRGEQLIRKGSVLEFLQHNFVP